MQHNLFDITSIKCKGLIITIKKHGLLVDVFPFGLVLDSNIWVDILVFNDLLTRPIRTAMVNRKISVWVNMSCYEELIRVLSYPQFHYEKNEQEKLLLWVRAYTYLFRNSYSVYEESNLPICKDSDDQKFIQLVYHCPAQFLLTKDKALLTLSRYMQQKFGIAVLTPENFCSNYDIS